MTHDYAGDTVIFHTWTRHSSQPLIVQIRLILANFHCFQHLDPLAPHTLYLPTFPTDLYLPLAQCLQKHGLARLSDLSLVGMAVWGIVWSAAGSSSKRLSLRKMIFLNWALWIFDICFHTMPSLKNLKGQFSPMENNRLELCKFKEICCLYFLSAGGERSPQNRTKFLVQPACRVRFWEHCAEFCILKSLFISIILQEYRILNDNIFIFILRWVFLVFKGKFPLK